MFDAFSSTALGLALAAFVVVLLLLEGAYLLWRPRHGRQARQLQARIQRLAAGRERARQEVLRQERTEGWLDRAGLALPLQALLKQAGLAWRPAAVVLASASLWAGTTLAAAVLARQAGSISLALGLLAGALPALYVLWRRHQRLLQLQQQLPEALDMMVRALRAGHAFSASLHMVADEMPEPMASEFRAVHEEVNFGLSLPQAFAHLVDRVPLPDLRFFVVAVLIQREAGGNLTELLAKLASLIRARLKLLARVQVLSSEGRLSGWILVLMPLALGSLLAWVNPAFMQPLWSDPLGQTLLKWTLFLMAVGVLLMRRIVRLRV